MVKAAINAAGNWAMHIYQFFCRCQCVFVYTPIEKVAKITKVLKKKSSKIFNMGGDASDVDETQQAQIPHYNQDDMNRFTLSPATTVPSID